MAKKKKKSSKGKPAATSAFNSNNGSNGGPPPPPPPGVLTSKQERDLVKYGKTIDHTKNADFGDIFKAAMEHSASIIQATRYEAEKAENQEQTLEMQREMHQLLGLLEASSMGTHPLLGQLREDPSHPIAQALQMGQDDTSSSTAGSKSENSKAGSTEKRKVLKKTAEMISCEKLVQDKLASTSQPLLIVQGLASTRGWCAVNGSMMLTSTVMFTTPMFLAKIMAASEQAIQDVESGKVQRIVRESIRKDGIYKGKDVLDVEKFNKYEAQTSTLIWDLVERLRIDSNQAREGMDLEVASPTGGSLRLDFPAAMRHVMEKFSPLNLSENSAKAEDVVGRIAYFMFPSFIFLNALAATVEFCRYRSACVYIAEDPHQVEFLEFLLDLPLQHFAVLCGKHCSKLFRNFEGRYLKAVMFGMAEQAFLDICGRLLNGLDKRPDLYATVAAKIKRKLDSGLALYLSRAESIISHVITTFAPHIDFSFARDSINLPKSLAALQDAVNASEHNMSKGWKSTFCMERHIMQGKFAKKNRGGKASSGALVMETFCYVCSNFGIVQKDLLRCSRCKTNIYCSKECQGIDWKREHKHECVLQSGTFSTGTMFTCTPTLNDWSQQQGQNFFPQPLGRDGTNAGYGI